MNKERGFLCGYGIDLLSLNESVQYVFNRFDEGESTHIITINPEMIDCGLKNTEFSALLKNAELVVPDGIGIKIGLKLNGIETERIAGIELAYSLLKVAAAKQISVALIGARNDIIEKACKNLKNDIPNLNIVYQRDGYFSQNKYPEIIEYLKDLGIGLFVIGTGAPKQEFFISQLRKHCTGIFIGVGGSFDVWSGEIKRAPAIFQKFGLEWLYRTLKEPKRLKRIFPALPLFLFRVIIELKGNRNR